jgi:RNA polymerase sigma-70 factor (ECF subfamily)
MEMEQSDLSEQDDRQLAEAVAALLEELPTERDRQMLMRFYLDGTDKQQLCRELGLSPKHFDRVLMRARTRLRTIIERCAPHLALVPRALSIFIAVGMTFTVWVRHFGHW